MRANREGQVVVVTGASAGIGRAAARAFGARGAHVALLARGEVGLEAAARDVEEAGGKAMVVPVDVADARQVEESADAVERILGPIDVWVNVAFTSVFAPFGEIAADEYKRVTDVNYLGFVYGTMAALRRMRDAGRRHHRAGRLGAGLSRAFRCRPRTAVPNMPSRVSMRRCAANSYTSTAMCTSRWCRCRR